MQHQISKVSPLRLLTGIHLLSACIIAALIGVFCLHHLQPPQTFWSYDPEQNYSKINALDEPNVSTRSLLRWATLAATSAYTINFTDFDETLEQLRDYFTQVGYENFRAALDESGRLQQIISDQLTVSAVNSIDPTSDRPSSTPVILNEGPIKGRYTWLIQLPLLLTYQGSSERSLPRYYVITLLVTRVPTSEAPKGIGIAQLTERAISTT